jgi:class 3 adenylate cyclase
VRGSAVCEPANTRTRPPFLDSVTAPIGTVLRHVFKVEAVGDCYVVVAGLPEPCLNHAQVMARFAWDCRLKMNDLVNELEVTLGPDTNELAIHIGLHSGPITAGVLRGDRARFQLFGDIVNTTSRIETTGKPDKMHMSQECVQLLMDGTKDHWLTPREDEVTAKGT